MSIKVLVINHIWYLDPRVMYQINALADSGYEVEILNWSRNGSLPNKSGESRSKIKTDWVNFKAPIGSLSLVTALPIFYWKVIRALRGKEYDVIHCTHLMLLPLALLVGRIKKAKVVYDAYELYSIDFTEYIPYFTGVRSVLRKMIEFFENRLVSRTDCVLTINTVNGFLTKRYAKYNDNVTVLYNVAGLDPDTDYEKLRELKEKYGGFKVIIYVGSITKAKGSLKLLDAISIVRKGFANVKLLLVGALKESHKGEVLRYIEEGDLEKNVEIIPWLPYEEMGYYLRIAQVGLAPYVPTRERFFLMSKGTGAKFFDYMQAGIPTIGPDYSEIGQVVKEENCGMLVDPTDAKQIARAIIYLLENPEESGEMGENGRRAVIDKYNWSIEKNKLLKAYDIMLQNSF